MKRIALLPGLVLGLVLGLASPPALPRVPGDPPAVHPGLVGVRAAQLDAAYWIARQKRHADRIVLDRSTIAAQNTRLRRVDPSLHDIAAVPQILPGDQVRAWIEARSVRPTRPLYDANGKQGDARQLDRLDASLDLGAIPATQVTRYGLATRRADLRTFPTRLRVFTSRGDTDIDRFQESALFPGTPVLIAHRSRDRKWWFVVSPTYAAWVERDAVAEGAKAEVFAYGGTSRYVVVTGATARTAFTPEQPQVSDLQLEMGLRLPLLADWPADREVNGQHPHAAHVVELPIRDGQGALQRVPALLPRSQDVASDYLPLTRANLLRQAFKFLGERYGWGHANGTRDCSGFVAEVYRSFGVQLPRNTGDQATSPAFDRLAFGAEDDHATRLDALRQTQVGDLVFIPGHVMMVVGHEQGLPYVIHDTSGISWRDDDGQRRRAHLNGVSLTPLVPLLTDAGERTVDRITSIQRIRRP